MAKNWGVIASLIVNGQDHLARSIIDVRHDILDERAQELLATAHVSARRVPGGLEIPGKAREVRNRIDRRLAPGLAGLYAPKRGFPALLKLGRNEPVLRVAGGVAVLGKHAHNGMLSPADFERRQKITTESV